MLFLRLLVFKLLWSLDGDGGRMGTEQAYTPHLFYLLRFSHLHDSSETASTLWLISRVLKKIPFLRPASSFWWLLSPCVEILKHRYSQILTETFWWDPRDGSYRVSFVNKHNLLTKATGLCAKNGVAVVALNIYALANVNAPASIKVPASVKAGKICRALGRTVLGNSCKSFLLKGRQESKLSIYTISQPII